ncbi:hypothetical protein ACHQM5_001346 [Ranunculus cassubicifolius]
MFSFLTHGRNLWKRDSTSILSFLHANSSISRLISTNSINENSLTVSNYLITSCGISEEKALSLSKKLQFNTSTKPDLVLNLFKENGFTKSQISKIIEKHPLVLVSCVDSNLRPKFDFFKSKGFSGPELAKSLSASPFVLANSLEQSIIPSFNALCDILRVESSVIALLKQGLGMQYLRVDKIGKYVVPNIEVLRACHVPDSHIERLLVRQPRALCIPTSRFQEIVEQVEKLEFDPSRFVFCIAIHALACRSKSNIEAKFNAYRRWGWSDDVIWRAFKKQPLCITVAEKKIMETMDYLVNKMGYDALLIADMPIILPFSFERRIKPRCLVIQLVSRNGLVPKEYKLGTLFKMTEENFLNKFVAKFKQDVPELLKIYQREVKINGLHRFGN